MSNSQGAGNGMRYSSSGTGGYSDPYSSMFAPQYGNYNGSRFPNMGVGNSARIGTQFKPQTVNPNPNPAPSGMQLPRMMDTSPLFGSPVTGNYPQPMDPRYGMMGQYGPTGGHAPTNGITGGGGSLFPSRNPGFAQPGVLAPTSGIGRAPGPINMNGGDFGPLPPNPSVYQPGVNPDSLRLLLGYAQSGGNPNPNATVGNLHGGPGFGFDDPNYGMYDSRNPNGMAFRY